MQNTPTLELMVRLADESSAIAMDFFRKRLLGVPIEQKIKGQIGGQADYVTAADIAIQQHVASSLLRSFPFDGFLAEENGLNIPSQSGYRWVLDPIDGTNQFVAGDHNWSCCVLARQQRKPDGTWQTVQSVTAAPTLETLYVSDGADCYVRNPVITGNDLFYNANQFGLSSTQNFPEQKSPANNLTVDFCMAGQEDADALIRKTLRTSGHGFTLRNMGSTALAAAQLAIMPRDGYALVSGGIKEWDIAAAEPMLHQTGYHTMRIHPATDPNYMVFIAAQDPEVVRLLASTVQSSLCPQIPSKQEKSWAQRVLTVAPFSVSRAL